MHEGGTQHSYRVQAGPSQKALNTALPGGQVQTAKHAAPITSLLKTLHSLRRVCMDVQEANQTLAALTSAAVSAHQTLSTHLAAFGWSASSHRWVCNVDLPGVQGCLKKFKYAKLQPLGHGSYGVVYKARDIETGQFFAVKKVLASDGSSTLREITTLRELSHPNIIRLRDVISVVGGSHVYLVLDCHDCDLKQYLGTCPQGATMQLVKSVMYQLLQGVAHIHANSILHRDLKPHNILMERDTGRAIISDFGLARSYLPPQKPYTEKMVTLYYRAPELLLGSPTYSRAVDVWSIGCIMAEMFLGKPLFQENTEVALIMRMCQTLGTPTEDEWPGITHLVREDLGAPLPNWPKRSTAITIPALQQDSAALDLLTKLLTYDPKQRISAAAALQHPWFHDVELPAGVQYDSLSGPATASQSAGVQPAAQHSTLGSCGGTAVPVQQSLAAVQPEAVQIGQAVGLCGLVGQQPQSEDATQGVMHHQAQGVVHSQPQGVMSLLRAPTLRRAVTHPTTQSEQVLVMRPRQELTMQAMAAGLGPHALNTGAAYSSHCSDGKTVTGTSAIAHFVRGGMSAMQQGMADVHQRMEGRGQGMAGTQQAPSSMNQGVPGMRPPAIGRLHASTQQGLVVGGQALPMNPRASAVAQRLRQLGRTRASQRASQMQLPQHASQVQALQDAALQPPHKLRRLTSDDCPGLSAGQPAGHMSDLQHAPQAMATQSGAQQLLHSAWMGTHSNTQQAVHTAVMGAHSNTQQAVHTAVMGAHSNTQQAVHTAVMGAHSNSKQAVHTAVMGAEDIIKDSTQMLGDPSHASSVSLQDVDDMVCDPHPPATTRQQGLKAEQYLQPLACDPCYLMPAAAAPCIKPAAAAGPYLKSSPAKLYVMPAAAGLDFKPSAVECNAKPSAAGCYVNQSNTMPYLKPPSMEPDSKLSTTEFKLEDFFEGCSLPDALQQFKLHLQYPAQPSSSLSLHCAHATQNALFAQPASSLSLQCAHGEQDVFHTQPSSSLSLQCACATDDVVHTHDVWSVGPALKALSMVEAALDCSMMSATEDALLQSSPTMP